MSTDTKNGHLDFGRAAAAALARRTELGLTQLAVGERLSAADASVNVDTYRRFERHNHTSYRRTTLAAISRALEWPPSALYDIACGKEAPAEPDRLDAITAEVSRISADVASLHELVASLTRSRRRPRSAPK